MVCPQFWLLTIGLAADCKYACHVVPLSGTR